VSRAELLRDLHEVLEPRHMDLGYDAIASVNRLLLKNPSVSEQLREFQLPIDSFSIGEELWSTAQLAALLYPSQVVNDKPAYPTGPFVVVKHGALSFLIDGRRRVHYWSGIGHSGPHRVLVLAAAS